MTFHRKQNRRKFVKQSSLVCTGLCTGVLGITSGCSPVTYVEATRKDQSLVVDKSSWGESEFVLIKHPKLSAPIYLRQEGQDYHAVLLECTHKKCEVRPGNKLLTCPCHGSEFSTSGDVLQGPAEDNLPSFRTWHDEHSIYLQ